MKFPPSLLDEIKARLPVSVVVGRRVRLQKAGREWKGLSPFGKERTPSFFVNDTKQAWFDFSSGRNGDIFTFLMETEGVPFPEAVERLAAEAGVPLPVPDAADSSQARAQEVARKGLYEVIDLAAAFFERELAGPRGTAARAYLANRGLAGGAQQMFRLGYAPPDRFALRDHLAGQGISREVMIEAGLLIHGEEIAVPYDRFRDRVMFPIADARGRVIAFGGRAMSADAQAKYLNTSDTTLFRKGSVLFNHHRARQAAHDTGRVIAVEGYVDVIAMTLAGFSETVAPLGTALTEDQLALLWRMSPEPILCFDGDKAGAKAAWRAMDLALPLLAAGRSLRFALLPAGQDPDDLYRREGSAAIETVIERATPLVDMLWAREYEAQSLDTPERRVAFERRIGACLASIRDEATRRHYGAELEGRLTALFPAPPRRDGAAGRGGARSIGSGQSMGRLPGAAPGWRAGRGAGGRFGQSAAAASALTPLQASPALTRTALFGRSAREEHPREALVLLWLAAQPGLLPDYADELAEMDWQGKAAIRVCQGLLQALVDVAVCAGPAGSGIDLARLSETVAATLAAPAMREAVARLEAVVSSAQARAMTAATPLPLVREVIHQGLVLHRRARTLHSELEAAEKAFAEEPSESHFQWLLDTKAKLQSLDGTEAGAE